MAAPYKTTAIPQSSIDYILSHHKENTAKEIAQQLGCSPPTVCKYLRRNDLKAKKVYTKQETTLQDKQRIANFLEDFVNSNEPITQVVKRHNITPYMGSRWISDHLLSKRASEETKTIVKRYKINDNGTELQ